MGSKNVSELNDEDETQLSELEAFYNLSNNDLKQIKIYFQHFSDGNGKVSRESWLTHLESTKQFTTHFLERIWSAFDQDDSGDLSFYEFLQMSAILLAKKGKDTEINERIARKKYEAVYDMCDLDHDEQVTRSDICGMLRILFRVIDYQKDDIHHANDPEREKLIKFKANELFTEIKHENKSHLTKQEFVEAAMEEPPNDIIQFLTRI